MSLLLAIASCTRSTRVSGSGSSVGRRVESMDTRLVQRSASSPVRIETGTSATSGSSGSASCSSSQVRSPPAQTAMTTSLTVAPKADLMALTAGSDAEPIASLRCGVILSLNGVRGGRTLGSGVGTSRSSPRSRPRLSTAPSGPRRLPRTWLAAATSAGLRVARPSSRAVRAPSSTARAGLRGSRSVAPTSISRSDGTRSGRHGCDGRRPRRRVGPVVEHQRQQLDARRAVDRRVVDDRQHREAVVGQPLDDVGQPQRPAPVQRPRDERG